MIDFSRIVTAEDKLEAATQSEQDARRAKARNYLADTDWMVLRAAEGGPPVPDDVVAKRAEARTIA